MWNWIQANWPLVVGVGLSVLVGIWAYMLRTAKINSSEDVIND